MKSNRVNEIDLLRFLAALAVVFFHYSFRGYAADDMSVMPYPLLAPFAKYGYLGVELFFMISGFVILMTAAGGSLRRFAISRLVRLYPAFWACCTITFAVTIFIGGQRYSASVDQYITNMTMLSGFLGVPPIDGVYWSLFVEMRFYVLVAILLFIGRIHQAETFLVLWLFASVILEILSLGKLNYLLIVDYSAYFIAGAMYYLIWSQGISLTRVGAVIAAGILASYQSVQYLHGFEKHYNTAMSSYVVVGIIAIFFIVMLLVSVRRTGFIGRNRWLTAGVLTYPLYLLHQKVGFMVFNVAYPVVNPHLLLWSTVIFMLLTAYFVHFFIEKKVSPRMKIALNYLFDSIKPVHALTDTAFWWSRMGLLRQRIRDRKRL